MKFILVAIFAIMAIMVLGDNHPCRDELDCEQDECCVQDFAGRGLVCRDLGDDIGDLCGGDFFCPHCERGLVCQITKESQSPKLKCGLPANGTCERPDRLRPIDQIPPVLGP